MKLKLDIHEDCHPALIEALRGFEEKAGPGLSTASRRHSIWSLCSTEVEPIIKQIFSTDHAYPILKDGFTKAAKKNARQLENNLLKIAKIYSNPYWIDQKIKQRYGTLETLASLIRFCKSFRPRTYCPQYGNNQKRELISRRVYRQGLAHFPFCELCEKLCEAEAIKAGILLSRHSEKSRPSSRYCDKHRPGGKDYRRDHNRREAFHEKIKDLKYALGHKTQTEGIEDLNKLLEEQVYFEEDLLTKFLVNDEIDPRIVVMKDAELRSHIKNYPDTYSEYEAIIRLVAYRIVHPQKEKTRRKTSTQGYTLNKLRESLAKGKNISEAAKDAGVSRQAGWKALKKAGDI